MSQGSLYTTTSIATMIPTPRQAPCRTQSVIPTTNTNAGQTQTQTRTRALARQESAPAVTIQAPYSRNMTDSSSPMPEIRARSQGQMTRAVSSPIPSACPITNTNTNTNPNSDTNTNTNTNTNQCTGGNANDMPGCAATGQVRYTSKQAQLSAYLMKKSPYFRKLVVKYRRMRRNSRSRNYSFTTAVPSDNASSMNSGSNSNSNSSTNINNSDSRNNHTSTSISRATLVTDPLRGETTEVRITVNPNILQDGTLSMPVITAFTSEGRELGQFRPLHYDDPQRSDVLTHGNIRLPGETERLALFLQIDDDLLLKIIIVRVGQNQLALLVTEQFDTDMRRSSSEPPQVFGASEAMLDALERIHVTEKVLEEGCLEECVICFDPYQVGDRAVHLNCGHEYHEKCARKWLVNQNSCPVCRVPIPPSQAILGPGRAANQASNSGSGQNRYIEHVVLRRERPNLRHRVSNMVNNFQNRSASDTSRFRSYSQSPVMTVPIITTTTNTNSNHNSARPAVPVAAAATMTTIPVA